MNYLHKTQKTKLSLSVGVGYNRLCTATTTVPQLFGLNLEKQLVHSAALTSEPLDTNVGRFVSLGLWNSSSVACASARSAAATWTRAAGDESVGIVSVLKSGIRKEPASDPEGLGGRDRASSSHWRVSSVVVVVKRR